MRQQERAGEGSEGRIQFWLEMGFLLILKLWSMTQVLHLCAPPSGSGSGSLPLPPTQSQCLLLGEVHALEEAVLARLQPYSQQWS